MGIFCPEFLFLYNKCPQHRILWIFLGSWINKILSYFLHKTFFLTPNIIKTIHKLTWFNDKRIVSSESLTTTTYQIPAHTFATDPAVLCPVQCISNKTVQEYLQLILITQHQNFLSHLSQWLITRTSKNIGLFSNWNLLACQQSGLVLHLTARMQSPALPSSFVCLEEMKHFWHIKLHLLLKNQTD